MLGQYTWSQIGGRYTYQFLNLTTDTRQAALGGKAPTVSDYDTGSAFLNPATINPEMHNQVQVNYVNYLADLNYGTAAYARQVDFLDGVVHAGITYLNYGNFQGYDERGVATNEFSSSEAAVSLGYARELFKNSGLHAGLSLKFITSRLEQYSSSGGAADLGLFYRPDEKSYRLAFIVRNLGGQFSAYNEVYEDIPLQVALGYSTKVKTLPLRLHVTLDNLQDWDLTYVNPSTAETDLEGNSDAEEPGFVNNFLRHTIIGAELFPEGAFNVRLGYNFRRGEELSIEDTRSFAGLSGGISVRFNKLRFSFTHARYSLAANSSFFGVHLNLD